MESECTKSKCYKVTITVGAADCMGSSFIKSLSNEVQQMVLQAKTMSPQGEVQIRSIIPCLNNHEVQCRIEQLNSAMEAICNDQQLMP